VNLRIRFEEEADAEYRAAGRWYETRRNGLGREFLDAVDATLQQLQAFPHSGVPVQRHGLPFAVVAIINRVEQHRGSFAPSGAKPKKCARVVQ
jgi:hypothetical protein